MRVPRILWLYVLREVGTYSMIGLLAVASILVSQNLLRRLDELAAVGFAARDSLDVLGCLFAMLLCYAVPVAFLFGVLVAFGRLSGDSEITAMRTCGIGIRDLIRPVFVLGVLVSVLTAVLVIDVEPRARRQLRSVLNSIASRGALVEPGRFRNLDATGDRILLIQAQGDSHTLEGVTIADRSSPERPFTVFAERGQFSFDEVDAQIHLVLENGSIHFEPSGGDDQRYQYIRFASLDYGIDASGLLEADAASIRPREMSMGRLYEVLAYFEAHEQRPPEEVRIKTREPYEVQVHRRLALPVAPMLFALIGVPLGIRRSRGARSFGVLLCVVLVFAYYTLLSVAEFLGTDGLVPASLALWLPNVAFVVAAVWVLYRIRYAET